jgi:Class II Aldolase and Adducin N-terminal domain
VPADEGVVKYTSRWTKGPAPDAAQAALLETWRRPLFDAGLIGWDGAHDVGYGNISVRARQCRGFLISGTQTGALATTGPEHYVLVTDYDIEANSVVCTGPVQASSESLTHAAIYELDPAIAGVVHVHSRRLWRSWLGRLPTTAPDVAYGTPEMAREIARLYRESRMAAAGVAVMAGHEDGLISFGGTLEEAATRMLELVAPER